MKSNSSNVGAMVQKILYIAVLLCFLTEPSLVWANGVGYSSTGKKVILRSAVDSQSQQGTVSQQASSAPAVHSPQYNRYIRVISHYIRSVNGRLDEPTANTIASFVLWSSQRNNLDPLLLTALLAQESSFNWNAVSPAGAMGIAQLMPGTAQALAVRNPFDPRECIDGGARYLAQQLHTFAHMPYRVAMALAAYNAGPGAVQQYQAIPPYRETQDYVRTIAERYHRLRRQLG